MNNENDDGASGYVQPRPVPAVVADSVEARDPASSLLRRAADALESCPDPSAIDLMLIRELKAVAGVSNNEWRRRALRAEAEVATLRQISPFPDRTLTELPDGVARPEDMTNAELAASIGRLCERVAGLETDVGTCERFLKHEAANGMALFRRVDALEQGKPPPEPVIVATAHGTQQVEVGYQTVELCGCDQSMALLRAIRRIGAFARDHEIGDSSKLSRIREECALILGWA